MVYFNDCASKNYNLTTKKSPTARHAEGGRVYRGPGGSSVRRGRTLHAHLLLDRDHRVLPGSADRDACRGAVRLRISHRNIPRLFIADHPVPGVPHPQR